MSVQCLRFLLDKHAEEAETSMANTKPWIAPTNSSNTRNGHDQPANKAIPSGKRASQHGQQAAHNGQQNFAGKHIAKKTEGNDKILEISVMISSGFLKWAR